MEPNWLIRKLLFHLKFFLCDLCDRWQFPFWKKKTIILKVCCCFLITKKTSLCCLEALWFPWFFSFWAVQLVGNLSLMDWSSLSERLSAQPIRLIWSCRIAFLGAKPPCQTLGLRSFVLQNEIDSAAATGGMPAGRLNCGDWRAIMNWRVEIAAPLLHYKCSLLTGICNQWAQAFCQSLQIRQADLLTRRRRRSHKSSSLAVGLSTETGLGTGLIPGISIQLFAEAIDFSEKYMTVGNSWFHMNMY